MFHGFTDHKIDQIFGNGVTREDDYIFVLNYEPLKEKLTA